MDANGLRFWMLANEDDWALPGAPPQLHYDRERRSLRLASQRLGDPLGAPPGDDAEVEALSRLEQVPATVDGFGTWAYWDPLAEAIQVAWAGPGVLTLFKPPLSGTPTDLAVGHDGVLYVAMAGRLLLYDLHRLWRPVTLAAPGFDAWRLAADPRGGVWVLDRTHRRLARAQGLPLPERPYAAYAAQVFRPCPENPNPPRLTVLTDLTWPDDETPVAIDCSPQGQVAVLSWRTGQEALVRLLAPGNAEGDAEPLGWHKAVRLLGMQHPYSMAWVAEDHIAVLWAGTPAEAPVYPVDALPVGEESPAVLPVGDFYPLQQHDGGPFFDGVTLPPHYPTREAGTLAPRPLHRLSLPAFAARGEATGRLPLDSGSPQTIWHRLYLEAHFPARGGIQVFLAATDDPLPPADPAQWHEHRFGPLFADSHRDRLPQGAWVSWPSELPFHPGLVRCPRRAGRAGLFTVLIQRSGRRVRTLRGRYLHVRVALQGDGRTTPELWALRAYGSRFSYVEHYLPALYHEDTFSPEADESLAPGESSTPADFLERFLGNMEGILTPLEDRIAASYLLTDPRTAPEEALAWLGSWIGVTLDTAYGPDRQRALIARAPELYRRRGTLAGLALALEVATGGGVSGGEIVIVEDWRLRRTFATILGAELSGAQDPLLAGLTVSGNSYVGDTLFLGDAAVLEEPARQEFLALFRVDQLADEGERATVQAFFDRLAHRVTVLVHQDVTPQDLGLIRRIVALETPAHVEVKVLEASMSLLVGLASLVGADTYLGRAEDGRLPGGPRPGEGRQRLPRSVGTAGGLSLGRPASLDPRLQGGALPAIPMGIRPPQAHVAPVPPTPAGTPFVLDASGSWAPAGRRIVRYIWRRVE